MSWVIKPPFTVDSNSKPSNQRLNKALAFALSPLGLKKIIAQNKLEKVFADKLKDVDLVQPESIMLAGFFVRAALLKAHLPLELSEELSSAYQDLCAKAQEKKALVNLQNVSLSLHQGRLYAGLEAIAVAIIKAYAEHLTTTIISERITNLEQALDFTPTLVITKAHSWHFSGLITTSDPRNHDFLLVMSTWGIAEDIGRKELARDEYLFHKPTLKDGFVSLVHCRSGHKEFRLDFESKNNRIHLSEVDYDSIRELSLTRELALSLAQAGLDYEQRFQQPLEIDWGAISAPHEKAGLYLLSTRAKSLKQIKPYKIYRLSQHGRVISKGKAIGTGLATGKVRLIKSRDEAASIQTGEILVTNKTEPDWEPYFKKAGAIVTEMDTRVSHSTILARELGIPAVLNATGSSSRLHTGQLVTVACCQGDVAHIYEGESTYSIDEYSARHLPKLRTNLMVNLSMPERALSEAARPWAGAGLVRSEFLFSGWIRIHPMAILQPQRLASEVQATIARLCRGYSSKREYFLDHLSQGVSLIASAFWPRPVLLRLSDLKSHEYKKLVGGDKFEAPEANPALGFRGASRYCHPEYEPAFRMEIEAIARVRSQMGLKNLHICIPFCRTPEEAEEVLEMLNDSGLGRGMDGLEVWMMAELPSNVVLADDFAALFDGFSIGSNDLTQLTLGLDRDNPKLKNSFDEIHPVMMESYQKIIDAAHKANRRVSFCGQIASEDPLFCETLAEMGIDSISVTPDAFSAALSSLGKK